MIRIIASAAGSVATLLLLLVVSGVIWESSINNHLYNCTDPFFNDFIFPGDWVHHPVSVDQVTVASSMSQPDTIKKGWTTTRLWFLWASFVLTSLLGGALAGIAPWVIRARSDMPGL